MILYSVDMCVPVRGHVRDRKKCCDILNQGADISGGGKFQPVLWLWRLVTAFHGHVRACAWICARLCVDMCVGGTKLMFPYYKSGGQFR